MSADRQSLVKGWCPGALRPMQTGDGLLVRLRITGGIVSSRVAFNLAEASREYGNGLIDLSARANLQLRGVTEKTLPPLSKWLYGMGLLDDDPAAEAVRNVVSSPLAGISPESLLDIRPLVAALEARLVHTAALHALPGKFGFAVDDGSRPGLEGVSADVTFRAVPWRDASPRFMITLAGMAETDLVCFCEPAALVDAADALSRTFLRLRDDPAWPARRMADLVRRVGAPRVFEAAGLGAGDPRPKLTPRPPSTVFDFPPTTVGGALGLAAPFGRWTDLDLLALATLADSMGCRELRLTPFRAILLPMVFDSDAEELREQWAEGFILSANDPRLAVAACPGAPACANGTTPTHEDALALAEVARALSPRGVGVHVSGCAKGCARQEKTPVTLVGRDGRYDLVLSGTAADAPAQTGLGMDVVESTLRAMVDTTQGNPA